MKTILVIDDEEQLRTDLIDILGFEGYQTIGAENGHEGVQAAQDHQPDLIICDISMPVMDGFAVLNALCQDSQTSTIPVILLSAHHDPVTVQKGAQLGAVDHLPKPYYLNDLLAAVRVQLGE